jgi:hypothetical protein
MRYTLDINIKLNKYDITCGPLRNLKITSRNEMVDILKEVALGLAMEIDAGSFRKRNSK